jgi:hypothetical protein
MAHAGGGYETSGLSSIFRNRFGRINPAPSRIAAAGTCGNRFARTDLRDRVRPQAC